MSERLLITLGIMLFVWVALSIMKRRQIASANRASRQMDKRTGISTVVYFWADGCHVCKNTQKRIIQDILAEYGSETLTLVSYNVDDAPDIAKKWGVRTLPTTFLLDSTGTIRHVNNGLVAAKNLRGQLETIILHCRDA